MADSIARAIKDMEEAKESHVLWADILDKKKERPKWTQSKAVDKVVGNSKYHRMWVRRYAHVIRILKEQKG